MQSSKTAKPKVKKPKPLDPLKWEIAVELGLDELIQTQGWGALTTKQSGKIGGIMAKRIKDAKAVTAEANEEPVWNR